MQLTESIKNDVLYLLGECPEKGTYYDEREDLTHHIDHGIIEVSTHYSDYRTYFVSMPNGEVCVRKTELDNYKLHERAKVIEGTMDDDDYELLASLVGSIASEMRSIAALVDLDMKEAARKLVDVLFANIALGPRPERTLVLKRNSSEIAKTVNAMLKKARRQAEFEWKEWPEIGVHLVNRLAPLKALDVTLTLPDEAMQEQVCNDGDFSEAVLNWFWTQLSPHGLMLIAITPIDELQRFSLVDIASFNDLRDILTQLTLTVRAACRPLCGSARSGPSYRVDGIA